MGLRRQFFSCTRSAIVDLELRTREYGNVFVAKKEKRRSYKRRQFYVIVPDSRVVEERWRFSLNIEDGTGYENGSISFLVVFCTPNPVPEF
jgi:hypothetical protein